MRISEKLGGAIPDLIFIRLYHVVIELLVVDATRKVVAWDGLITASYHLAIHAITVNYYILSSNKGIFV